MHAFLEILLAASALLWVFTAVAVARGVLHIPSLANVDPLRDEDCPAVSILFAARDEAEKLPRALETMLALDYPCCEVVAVDDRSEDATQDILRATAARDPRLHFTRVNSLPPGWLGKPHALEQAYEQSSGEWLVFTDADVHFERDVLRRALTMAIRQGWDHMPLLGRPQMVGVGEKIAMAFFGFSFLVGVRPWNASKTDSSCYAGVGAFQLIRRSTYEAVGTHRRLAMEVIDDVKLGKMVKEGGFRSGVARAGNGVTVRWHAGIRNMILGTTKNFFAASGFRLWLSCLHVAGLLLMSVFPWVAFPLVHGWARIFAAISVSLAVILEAGVALEFGISPLYGLTHPIGALIFAWMLARSTIVTLWQGGITWRGTFYPLDELKRGIV
jgi:glycosyltransferase involved in cell wall biosynthesis